MLEITKVMKTIPTLALFHTSTPENNPKTAIRWFVEGNKPWGTMIRDRDLDEVLALEGDRYPDKHSFRSNFRVIFLENQVQEDYALNFVTRNLYYHNSSGSICRPDLC